MIDRVHSYMGSADVRLFHHEQADIEQCAAAMAEFEDERAGLFGPVATSPKPDHRVRTAREVLFGEP